MASEEYYDASYAGMFDESTLDRKMWDFMESNMEDMVEKMFTSRKFREVTDQLRYQEESIHKLSKENELLRKRLAIAEGAITRSELKVQRLEDKVTYLTSRSMRDNIIIKNMAENDKEDPSLLKTMIRSFLVSDLKINERDMESIVLERYHRFGRKVQGRARNIVVKLNSRGKEIVMAHLKNLDRNNKIKVSQQLPPEVQAKRNKLWPQFKEAKNQGKRVTWKQDQLVVDGRVREAPQDKNTDINKDPAEAATKLKLRHTAVSTKDGSHYQGHSVSIASTDDVIPAVKALCSDVRVAGASHVLYAYRVGNDQQSFHNWEDDGEWGGGRMIMEAIQDNKLFNQLICVTRWGRGENIGVSRFGTIKELANQTINAIQGKS